MENLNQDLDSLSHEELKREIVKLRAGIRAYRDNDIHELLRGNPRDRSVEDKVTVPEWPRFLKGVYATENL